MPTFDETRYNQQSRSFNEHGQPMGIVTTVVWLGENVMVLAKVGRNMIDPQFSTNYCRNKSR